MTYECGIRFLADYIDGEVYFRTAYAEHNLDRARNQFKLVSDMEAKMDEMQRIVNKYSSRYLYTGAHKSTIHNSKMVEIMQMSISR